MIIDRIEVVLEPYHHMVEHNKDIIQLRMTVHSMGKKYNESKLLYSTSVRSNFEQYLDYSINELKEALREQFVAMDKQEEKEARERGEYTVTHEYKTADDLIKEQHADGRELRVNLMENMREQL